MSQKFPLVQKSNLTRIDLPYENTDLSGIKVEYSDKNFTGNSLN